MNGLDYLLIFGLTNLCAFSVYFTRKLFKLRCTTLRCCGMEMQQDLETGEDNRHATTTSTQPEGILRV